MIDGTFIDRLVHNAATEVITADGKDYTSKPVFNPPLPNEPLAQSFEVHTLTGICDYVKAAPNLDQLKNSEMVLHIESATVVRLYSAIRGTNRVRETYITAEVPGEGFPFGIFMAHANFMVAFQTHFLDFGDRAKLLHAIGTIKSEEVRTSKDDGTSQSIVASAGTILAQEILLPNPCLLKPYRTFVEVDQPPSEFILRLQGSGKPGVHPSIALFEGDCSRWALEAIANIKEFVVGKLASDVVILA